MNHILTQIVESVGLTGFWADLLVSGIIATVAMLFAILVGLGIEKLNRVLIGKSKVMQFVLNRIMFVGTVFHELSHALFAVLTGAKVLKIKCFTLFDKTRLGYVEFAYCGKRLKQALQASFISCAPVMTGFITVPLFFKLGLAGYGILWSLLFFYISLSILVHMKMSKTDLKLYLKGAVLTFPLLTLVILSGRFLLGIR